MRVQFVIKEITKELISSIQFVALPMEEEQSVVASI